MRRLREWLLRLAGQLRPRRTDDDLAEELRMHMELAAEHGARLTGAVQAMDSLRDQRGLPWLDDGWRDMKHGVRALMRSKGFTATALISLALGIGANTGIFTLLDQVLLRPLPVRDPQQLVQVAWQGNAVGVNYGGARLISYPLCRDLADRRDLFDGVLCRHPTEVNVSFGQQHEDARAEIVSGSYFELLGIRPALGRLIGPSDDRQPGAHPVVVLSHDYWMTRLGGASGVVGRRVLINNYPMTVIGVAPASFRGIDVGAAPALWLPTMMKRQATLEWDALWSRRTFWIHAIGRLRPGITAEQARARLQPWFKQMLQADLRQEEFPPVTASQRQSFLASTIDVTPAAQGISGLRDGFERPLHVLMGGALLLLGLTALNLAGLLLARGLSRTRELATRMALGASRNRVVRQLLMEALLMVLGGGALGIAAAPLIARVLRSFLPAGASVGTAIDTRVVLFALGAMALTGAVCGIVPMIQLRRLTLAPAMTERSGTAGRHGVRARKVLIAGQIAFALILLVLAGLFVQTLQRLKAKGPGFATSNLMMFGVDPTAVGYPPEQAEQVMREILRRLRERPEITSAAVANTRILNGGRAGGNLTVAADQRRVTDRIVYRLRVGPGFFETLGLQLVAGRTFEERDIRPSGTPPGPFRTAIVNDTFAKRYFGDRNPVGARIGAGNRPDTPTNIEIIGVVREVSRVDLRDRDVDQVFYNYWDNQSDNGSFYVRARDSAAGAAQAIRAVVADVDPRLPVVEPTTVDDQIAQSLSNERALATLSTGFGLLALSISLVGLYGIMAFVVAQRRPEIGLRLALGARRGDAAWLIVRDALTLVAVGIAVALPAVWGLRRIVEGQLYGVTAVHVPTLGLAIAGLVVVAISAAAIPAWRASRVDPNLLLRME